MCTAGDNLFEICHSSSCEDLWTNNNQQSSTRHEDTTGTCAEWQFGLCDGAYLTRSSAHLRGPSQKLLREMIGKFAWWLMYCAVVFVIRRQQLCEMKIDKCLKWLWDNLMNKWMCTPHDEWQSAGRQSWQLQCKSQIMALSNVLRFHFDDPASQQKYILNIILKGTPVSPFQLLQIQEFMETPGARVDTVRLRPCRPSPFGCWCAIAPLRSGMSKILE